MNGFAELKITCSIQRPEFGNEKQQIEKIKEWFLNSAIHADITVIDWRLTTDRHLAEDLIIDLLQRDKNAGGRTRLICVYTTQPNPANILKDIKDRIIEELQLPVTGNKKDLAYSIDKKARIAVFNKEAAGVPATKAKIVSFNNLPQASLEEFATLIEGLIPCTALHSIAVVREQAHNILALMNKSLDGAFCSHRSLLPDPDDSTDFILNLISEEVATRILSDHSARESLEPATLKVWFDEQEFANDDYSLEKKVLWQHLEKGGANLTSIRKQRAEAWINKKEAAGTKLRDKDGTELSCTDAKLLVSKGDFTGIDKCVPPSDKNPARFVGLFYQKQSNATNACSELTRLTCSAKDESDSRKGTLDGMFLTLGSVLKVTNCENEYWLCLQPSCDSVRLTEKTTFLFLQLFKGQPGNTDIIIKLEDGSYVPLSIKPPKKKPKIKTHPFTPCKKCGRVLAKLSRNRNHKWVGELRPEKALAIAHRVLTNASRIGLDEFEILRRTGSQI